MANESAGSRFRDHRYNLFNARKHRELESLIRDVVNAITKNDKDRVMRLAERFCRVYYISPICSGCLGYRSWADALRGTVCYDCKHKKKQ